MAKRSMTDPKSKRKARTAYLLSKAHFAMRVEVDSALKQFDITGVQYTVLSLVDRHPGLSSAALSRRFYRTQQAMGQLLMGLEEKGWLIRSEDPQNRRMLMVTLTEEGHKVVKAGEVELDRVEQDAFSAFSDDDMEVFRRVLESMDRAITQREESLL